jgi:hypothetical protein
MDGNFDAKVSALMVLEIEKLTWENVTNAMIEAASRYRRNNENSSALVTSAGPSSLPTSNAPPTCGQYYKPGHHTEQCWWNPKSPNNKLPKGNGDQGKLNNNRKTKTSADSNDEQQNASDNSDRNKDKSNKSKEKKDKDIRLNVTSATLKSHEDNSSLLDSGASAHMCPNRHWFQNMHTIPTREIRLGDNSVVTSEAVGDINMSMPYHTGGTLTLKIGNVLYVPKLGLNLLSYSRLAKIGKKQYSMIVDGI